MDSARQLLERLDRECIPLTEFREAFLREIRTQVDNAVEEKGDSVLQDYDGSVPFNRQRAPGPAKGGILRISFQRDEEGGWNHRYIDRRENGYFFNEEFCDCGQYTSNFRPRDIREMPVLQLAGMLPGLAEETLKGMQRPRNVSMTDTGYGAVLEATVLGIPHYRAMKGTDYGLLHQIPKEGRQAFLEKLAAQPDYFGQTAVHGHAGIHR